MKSNWRIDINPPNPALGLLLPTNFIIILNTDRGKSFLRSKNFSTCTIKNGSVEVHPTNESFVRLASSMLKFFAEQKFSTCTIKMVQLRYTRLMRVLCVWQAPC
jgi:hypothetical protein